MELWEPFPDGFGGGWVHPAGASIPHPAQLGAEKGIWRQSCFPGMAAGPCRVWMDSSASQLQKSLFTKTAELGEHI